MSPAPDTTDADRMWHLEGTHRTEIGSNLCPILEIIPALLSHKENSPAKSQFFYFIIGMDRIEQIYNVVLKSGGCML